VLLCRKWIVKIKAMTNEEIINGNRIIAEFDGRQLSSYQDTIVQRFLNNYHRNWNNLIPVCKKYSELNIGKSWDNFCEHRRLTLELTTRIRNFEILPVFEQLVKCIQWYNQIKSDQ
jgi:hypothetical protein